MMNFFNVDPFGFSPELDSPVPRVIANQIDCNLDQPGVDAALAAKCLPVSVRIPEAVLG